jgi:tetratricopeptide (TPR) repeat protein
MENREVLINAARWTAVSALFLLPLVPLVVVDSFFFPYITGKAFTFRILVEIATAGWVLLALLDRRYRPQFSWLGAVFAALVVWMFVADCLGINPGKALWSNFERMEGWVTVVHLFALFAVAGSVLTVGKLWRGFWLTSLGVSLIVSAYGLLQLAGIAAIHQGSSRLDATLGNAEYLSAYFLFHIFIAGWLTITEYKNRTWLRYALPLVALLETFLLFETQTRGAVLGLVAGVLTAAVLASVSVGGKIRRYALASLVAVLVLAGGFFLLRHSSFIENSPALSRIASISIDQGSTRFTLWHMAYEGFLEHPVFGWGQEGYNYVFNKYYEPSLYTQEAWFDRAHDWYIDWLVAGGLPAFVFALGLFVLSFWQILRRTRDPQHLAIAALLVAYAVYAVFVFDNLITATLFTLVIAYVHQNGARPLKALEELPELGTESGTNVAAPVVGVLLLATLYFVNVPGMTAAGELIDALTPGPSGVAGIVTNFKDLLTHPAFGAQEIREQLVSIAFQAVTTSAVSVTDKTAIATLAVSEMQKQVAAFPLDAREHLQLALAYRMAGDRVSALAEDKKAETLSPNKEAIYIEEGAALLKTGDVAGAKAAFDKAYALGPQFPQLAVYAAAGAIATGDVKGGQALLVKNFGTTVVDSEELITAYYDIKDWPDLIILMKQYVIDQEGSASAYFRLASTFVAAGNLNLAKQAVEEGIKADPSAAATGQKLLSQLAAMGAP